jgi:hypothetical protein
MSGIPPLNAAHLIQIKLRNFVPDKRNSAELDGIGHYLSNIHQSCGHVPGLSELIGKLTDHITTLKNPEIPIGMAELPPDSMKHMQRL